MNTLKFTSLSIAAVACCVAGIAADAADDPRSNPRAGVDFYLQTYGRVAPRELGDVYAVFEKVRAVADKSSLATPQLIVVADDKQASAFALADGTVFLSKKALTIIREGANKEQAQARLAFVLGHELAHLASNDFWDNQISQALIESSTASELQSIVDSSAGQQKKELKADDLGFVYAALAGYGVDNLLQSSGANDDFLSFWNAKAGMGNDPNYPQPAQRASLLRLRLREMHGALQYFEFGSRLMHFGRYREAIALLREFQKQFPGRELFNNLGYCHLRMALDQLDPDYAYRYWLPMLADSDTPLAKLTVRSGDYAERKTRMPAAARENLLQAARYFELAGDKDVTYAPSYLNLAVVQLLLGMDSDARLPTFDGNHLLHAKIAIGSALKLRPDDSQAKMLGAIVDYELQMGDKTAARNATLPPVEPGNPSTLYNLAQLSRADAAQSGRYWQQLATQFDVLPRKLQALACRRQGHTLADIKSRCDSLATAVVAIKAPWNTPIKLSRDLLDAPPVEAEMREHGWQKNALATGTALVGPRSSVLAIDDVVTLAVLKRVDAQAESLIRCCAQPLEKISIVNGTLWHYGKWIALVREQRVEEIWFAN